MLFKDASLVTYSESNKHAVLNGARIKEATGQEKMAGRKNYGDMINFKPKCHHWLCSNYDLDVGGATDHGLWRRIEYNPLKIKFVDPKLEPYDENDPYQRIADDAVTQSWTEDPEILGRYMGIMTWFHYKLYRDYRGKVKSIPHPHINFETEKYRRRQDVIASFIAQRFVKTADATNQYEMIKEIQKYIKWHALNHGAIPAKGLIETFQNSQISKHIKLTKRGLFLTGHRFLDTDEKLDDGEEYAMKHIFDLAVPDDNFGIIPETTDQFYERTCREYDDLKHIFSNDPKYDVAIDTVVDYNAIGGNTDNLDSMTNNDIPKHKPRNDNLEINGRILSCGVVLHSLDSPSRKIDTYSYHADLSGYIEEMEEMEEMEAA
jgi:hypothetical protein